MEHFRIGTRRQLVPPARPPADAGGRFFVHYVEESEGSVVHRYHHPRPIVQRLCDEMHCRDPTRFPSGFA